MNVCDTLQLSYDTALHQQLSAFLLLYSFKKENISEKRDKYLKLFKEIYY